MFLLNSLGIGILTKKYRENAKNAYFGHLAPFNEVFSQIHPYRPPWNNFSNFLEKNFFDHFPKILTYDVIFTPANEAIWDIFT